jgi:tetraacyldisaccharide 4'-kinase
MGRRPIIERLWQPELTGFDTALWAALTPLAALYRGVLAVRSRWWRHMARESPVATISVGNLTVGGNGKTPFTLFLAQLLQRQGYRVAIVSRGYGRSGKARAVLAAEGGKLLAPFTEVGDEPAMMARSFDGPIAVARRRLDGIKLVLERGPLDVVILDDAFQHRGLRRDLDLVLIGALRGFGNGWPLPAGPLREPLSALRRADAIVMLSSAAAKQPTLCGRYRAALEGVQLIRGSVHPRGLVRATQDGWIESALALKDRRVVAVCGLADPGGFGAMLRELGCDVIKVFEYPDHHRYQRSDWDAISAAAPSAELVLTTEKDLIKLEVFCPTLPTLYAVRIEVVMAGAEQSRLIGMASRCIEARRAGTPPTPPLRTPS